ncbi:hypothetical protein AcV7_002194 [Taiwanofungus camphoratus]|nr:hypothetical protein AcV7_002194 [Antrodia cinnamomea]
MSERPGRLKGSLTITSALVYLLLISIAQNGAVQRRHHYESCPETAHSPMSSTPISTGSNRYDSNFSSTASSSSSYGVSPLLSSSLPHNTYSIPAITQPHAISSNLYSLTTLPSSASLHTYTLPAPSPLPGPPSLSIQIPRPSSSTSYMPSQVQAQYRSSYPAASCAPSDVVAYLGNYPITESSKCTEALAGATFVQSASLEYKGKKALMFVFSDLAVKTEGTFLLRYRVFNIFSKAYGDKEIPIMAECYGGPFKIYSTKEFPGLRASTDLTKHISFFGVRLNLRENERKRRKKSDHQSSGETSQVTVAGPSSAVMESPTMSVSSTSTVADGQPRRRGKDKRTQRKKAKSSEDDRSAGGDNSDK